jgi:outer membrane protein TolC
MLDEGASRARAVYDAALMQFRRGLTDLKTVLDAEAAWHMACEQASAARLDALLRSVQLFKVLGGGWDAVGLLQAAPK